MEEMGVRRKFGDNIIQLEGKLKENRIKTNAEIR